MKRYCCSFLICCFFNTDIFSQEIRIKRQFFVPQSEYYSGDKLIGNSTRKLAYFIETNSQDSLIIRQIKSSERLSKIYPKMYLYSSIATGIGGVGLGYVIFKGTSDILKRNNDPSLGTIARGSLGIMSVGIAGLIVSGGYFISSQIKLRKAIKGYNKNFQTDKVTIDFYPYFQLNDSGMTVRVNF